MNGIIYFLSTSWKFLMTFFAVPTKFFIPHIVHWELLIMKISSSFSDCRIALRLRPCTYHLPTLPTQPILLLILPPVASLYTSIDRHPNLVFVIHTNIFNCMSSMPLFFNNINTVLYVFIFIQIVILYFPEGSFFSLNVDMSKSIHFLLFCILWMYVKLFIYSPVKGHFYCFQLFAIPWTFFSSWEAV